MKLQRYSATHSRRSLTIRVSQKAKNDSRHGKRVSEVRPDDILPEYDFSHGRRNKYAARYREGTNIVLLDPDVAALFPNSVAVNAALRALGRNPKSKGARRPRKRRTA